MTDDETESTRITVPVQVKGVTFDLAVGDEPARFVLGLRKCGSTLLNLVITFIAQQNDLHTVALPDTFFYAGMKLADWQDADLSDIVRHGNMYIGFRAMPRGLAPLPIFAGARKVLMFRDPRDALVSQYYSDAYSHSLPTAETDQGKKLTDEVLAKRQRALSTDINDYVLTHAPSMDRTFMGYAEVLKSPLTLPLRYEEYIFQKKRMVHKIVDHFDLKIENQAVEELMTMVDILPRTEDTTSFVRNVIPGDHRRKLKPETIEALDKKLQNSMRAYDYY